MAGEGRGESPAGEKTCVDFRGRPASEDHNPRVEQDVQFEVRDWQDLMRAVAVALEVPLDDVGTDGPERVVVIDPLARLFQRDLIHIDADDLFDCLGHELFTLHPAIAEGVDGRKKECA